MISNFFKEIKTTKLSETGRILNYNLVLTVQKKYSIINEIDKLVGALNRPVLLNAS